MKTSFFLRWNKVKFIYKLIASIRESRHKGNRAKIWCISLISYLFGGWEGTKLFEILQDLNLRKPIKAVPSFRMGWPWATGSRKSIVINRKNKRRFIWPLKIFFFVFFRKKCVFFCWSRSGTGPDFLSPGSPGSQNIVPAAGAAVRQYSRFTN